MTELKEIQLPDFEDMYKTLAEINRLAEAKASLELRIDALYSDVVKEVTSNPIFFIKDKPAPMTYIERTYYVGGLDGELLPLREELSKVTTQLSYLKMKLKLDNSIVDVWRTQSANRRRVSG